jgi:hypothetical protein
MDVAVSLYLSCLGTTLEKARSYMSLLMSALRHLVHGMKLLGSFSRSTKCIERRFFTKIITRMVRKLQEESIKSN